MRFLVGFLVARNLTSAAAEAVGAGERKLRVVCCLFPRPGMMHGRGVLGVRGLCVVC